MVVSEYQIPPSSLAEIESRMRRVPTFTTSWLIDMIKAYAREIGDTFLAERAMRVADRLVARDSKAGKITKSGGGMRARWSWTTEAAP